MKKALKILAGLLLPVLLILGAVKLVRHKKALLQKTPPPSRVPLPVEGTTVQKGRWALTEHYLGELRPLRVVRLASRVTGYLLEVRKYEGERVAAGELLVRVDDRKLRAQMRALKAEIVAAEIEFQTRKAIYERDKVLWEKKALSQEAYDLSRSAYEGAWARLKRLREELAALQVDLAYTEIKAPFSGVISRRFKEPGDMVLPGMPILELEAPEAGYRILVRIPQKLAAQLPSGTEALLKEGGQTLKARVHRIHPAVDPEGLAVVEIRVSKRPFGLPSGAHLGVELVIKELEGLGLPPEALLETTQGAWIYALEPLQGDLYRVKVLPVKVLGRSAEKVVVAGEIVPGQKVVVAGESTLLRLHNGSVVRLVGEIP